MECELKNGSGDKVMLNGTTPLEATFDAFRFIEMTHFRILGADYGMHAIVPNDGHLRGKKTNSAGK